jgi:hypothetical protein
MKNKSKKFGSFLITGKAATLPFLANNSFAETPIDILFNAQEQHLIQLSAQGINVLNATDEVDVAARIVYPGQNCTFPPPSNTMNVVVTGLRKSDHVYISSASDKNHQAYLSIDPKFKIGNTDLRILTDFIVEGAAGNQIPGFTYGGGDLENANFTISVPVNLNIIPKNNSEFYMQALIVRGNQLLFSELDRIEAITQTCDMYGNF